MAIWQNNKQTTTKTTLLTLALIICVFLKITPSEGCYWECSKRSDSQMDVYAVGCVDAPRTERSGRAGGQRKVQNETSGNQQQQQQTLNRIKYFIRTTNTQNVSVLHRQCTGESIMPRSYKVSCVKNYTEHDYLIKNAEIVYWENGDENGPIISAYRYTISKPQLETCLKHTITNLTYKINDNECLTTEITLSWKTLLWDKHTFVKQTVISVDGRDEQTLTDGRTQFPICPLSDDCWHGKTVCVRLVSQYKTSSALAKECVNVTAQCNSSDNRRRPNGNKLTTITTALFGVIGGVLLISIITYFAYTLKKNLKCTLRQREQANGPRHDVVEQRVLVVQTTIPIRPREYRAEGPYDQLMPTPT